MPDERFLVNLEMTVRNLVFRKQVMETLESRFEKSKSENAIIIEKKQRANDIVDEWWEGAYKEGRVSLISRITENPNWVQETIDHYGSDLDEFSQPGSEAEGEYEFNKQFH